MVNPERDPGSASDEPANAQVILGAPGRGGAVGSENPAIRFSGSYRIALNRPIVLPAAGVDLCEGRGAA